MIEQDKIQEKIIKKIEENQYNGIVLSSVRSGKTRILLKTLESFIRDRNLENPKILVLYPFIDIKKSWKKEMEILEFGFDITFSTYISFYKKVKEDWDIIIGDEAHLIPNENVLPLFNQLRGKINNIIFASGTFSESTLVSIYQNTGLKKIVDYSTENAINDGIISDFKIIVHMFSLDNTIKVKCGTKKTWFSTDYKECSRLTKKVQESKGNSKMFYSLQRRHFVNSCDTTKRHVKTWIKNNKDKRYLLFVGNNKIGEEYGLPLYSSASIDDSNLIKFQNQEINQLILIKKGSIGITYPNLDTIVLTAIDSNSDSFEQIMGRGLLKDTDNVTIHIFISDEPFQQKWLLSALEKIDKNKIEINRIIC